MDFRNAQMQPIWVCLFVQEAHVNRRINMPKMSRFNKIPWWLQALSGSGQNAQSPFSGAPSIRSIKRSSKDPQEVQRRLDELFDGSEVVKFYSLQVGVKPKDLVFGAHARGYERRPSEQIGEWAIEVYQKTKRNDEVQESTEGQ